MYSECMFLDLGIQYSMRMRYIVVCGQCNSTVFFHIISKAERFYKKIYWTRNLCFDFLYKVCLKYFSS